MRNTDLISKKLEEALCYLYNNEQKLKPLIEYLQAVMIDNIKKENISYIKINNITLFKLDSSRTIVKEYLDLELYSIK